MLMVEVVEVPQHQASQEEEEAGAHSWDYRFHFWTPTEGWQEGPAMCCHFCLLEVVVGGGLRQKRNHLDQAYLLACISTTTVTISVQLMGVC